MLKGFFSPSSCSLQLTWEVLILHESPVYLCEHESISQSFDLSKYLDYKEGASDYMLTILSQAAPPQARSTPPPL